jgi:putative PIN family toxin of toxin-antitoxin system
MNKLVVCIDANVYISGIAFNGKPLKVIEHALNRDFILITGPNILDEVKRNLLGKLGLKKNRVDTFIDDILEISTVYVPSGKIQPIHHKQDNLVLEVALMGGCDVLITGDKKHLLPLSNFQGIAIEPPSRFLARLNKNP